MALLVCTQFSIGAPVVLSGPQPGEVYKEFKYQGCCANEVPTQPSLKVLKKGAPEARSAILSFNISDLEHAVRAEAAIHYWGGHVGVSKHRIVLNGNENSPIYCPQVRNAPGKPECFYHMMFGNISVPVPLSQIKRGTNKFQYVVGKQICHSFNWPAARLYSFVIRVYYNPKLKPHVSGEIQSPATNSTIGDNHEFKVAIAPGSPSPKQVDYIGHYFDFDWAGNGLFEKWHYQLAYGKLDRHVGKSTSGPAFPVKWSTTWLPDQEKPMRFMARIKSADGTCFISNIVDNITLSRSWSVKMGKAINVPEKFSVRAGQTKSCDILLPAGYAKAKANRLLIHSWGAHHPGEPGTEIRINGKKLLRKFGAYHSYSFDTFPVPVSLLDNGRNQAKFTIFSQTKHHMCEINWPGPVMLFQFGDSVPKPGMADQKAQSAIPGCIPKVSVGRGEVAIGMARPVQFGVDLISLQGKTLRHTPSNGQRELIIPMAGFVPGVYVVRVGGQGVEHARRIVWVR